MRFTKIPLIATLMAVALSLLIVLPALAQNTADHTDGQLTNGGITVGVFANIEDAELAKMTTAASPYENNYVPRSPIPPTPATSDATQAAGEEAWLKNNTSSPQDTRFQNRLYVSNDGAAYNTVLVNFLHPVGATNTATCKADPNDADANVTATIKNNRSGKDITIELVLTTTAVGGRANSQAFFKVVHEDIAKYDNNTPDDATDDIAYRMFNGPTWCDDDTAGYDHDEDNDPNDLVANETAATSARYYPVDYVRNATSGLYPANQEIGTIFARHGDRLTVTVSGTSGSVDVEVDGEGPDFTAVTPDDNAVTRASKLNFSFEVRDDDSGLRHDGEAVITPDGDYQEVNPDGDHDIHIEPLTIAAGEANGEAADIDVNVVKNPEDGTDVTYEDISASGTWRMAASRAGIAYAFTASGADRGDAPYLYQLEAYDRVRNMATTDADLDTPKKDPYVFRVDGTDPSLKSARTGISYDTAKNVEKVDRNFIALDFNDDALGEVDTSNITVVGHTIIESVIHPSKAPEINRNTKKATPPTGPAPDEPTKPANYRTAAPAASYDHDNDPDTTALTFDGGCTGTEPVSTATLATLKLASSVVGTLSNADPLAAYTAYCGTWEHYRLSLIYDKEKEIYDNYNQYARENPGRDIENGWIPEPRARIYLQLADDLASDERPTVVIVGGAVYDLAGQHQRRLDAGQGGRLDSAGPDGDRDRHRRRPPRGERQGRLLRGRALRRGLGAPPGGLFRRDRGYAGPRERRQRTTKADDEWSYKILDDDDADGTSAGKDNVDTAANLTQQEDENHWAKTYKTSSIEEHFERPRGHYRGGPGRSREHRRDRGLDEARAPGQHDRGRRPERGRRAGPVQDARRGPAGRD